MKTDEKQTAAAAAKAVDWEGVQECMDAAFHNPHAVYPRGSAEHKEAVEFVPRLSRFLDAREQREAAASGSSDDRNKAPSNPLGLPGRYNPRYRVNVSVVADHEGVGRAIRDVGGRGRGGSEARGAAGEGGLAAAARRYSSLLGHYEDFRQKKSFGRILKLREGQAALPIAPFEQQLTEALRDHSVILLAGDTGCGKSTQLPQFLLRAGFSKVAVTQPRRISAMALCRRVAHETLNEHGNEVAYQIRFDSSRGSGTRLTFMTEGILLRRLAGDPLLEAFDCVVLDEVHERHLSTDFLLALLRAIVLQRPSLRVVLMSATINVAAYSSYFGGVPVVSVPGRLYPISVVYLPPATPDGLPRRTREEAAALVAKGAKRRPSSSSSTARLDPQPFLRVLQRIDKEVPRDERGDVLVFLSGMDDISLVWDALSDYAERTQRWVVLRLHSSLPVEDQDRVFDPVEPGVRKCILSTNIAETSVTIDGIRFVVDSGRCKEMLHDTGSGVGSLQEGWVSRASAEQRKGRAGRTGPGTCYRLYSDAEFSRLPPYNLPEIQRVRLESVVLQIKQLAGGAMDPREFGFIDPPPRSGLEDAIGKLRDAQALDGRERMTPLGAILASLPVGIHVGKMMVLGCALGCSQAVITIAAALSVQTPFLRVSSSSSSSSTATARREVESEHGDAFTLLNLFEQWIQVKDEIRSGRRGLSSRKWCKARGVEEQRLYEIAKLRRQFEDLLRSAGLLRRERTGTQQRQQHQRNHHPGGARGGSRGGNGDNSSRSRAHLRELQRRHETESRKRRVLRAGDGGGYGEDDGNDDAEEAVPSKRRRRERDNGGERGGGGTIDVGEELRQRDVELTVDLKAMASAAAKGFTLGDLGLLKFVVSAGLYPNLAAPALGNMHRRDADVRFHARGKPEAALHPSSVMAPFARELGTRHLVAYAEALETRSLFLCTNTPVPALATLLLNAAQLDTSLDGSRVIADGWLLLRIHGGGGGGEGDAGDGAKALVAAARARRLLGSLLSQKLKDAKAASSSNNNGIGGTAPSSPPPPQGPHQTAPPPPFSLPRWATTISEEWQSRTDEATAAEVYEEEDRHHPERLLASMVAEAFHWPLNNSVERLSGSAAAAAHYEGGEPGLAGYHVTPWLRVGALRSAASEMAAHATMTALRRHWRCPGCGTKVIGTASDISDHVTGCQEAAALPQEQLEAAYNPSSSTTGGTAAAAAATAAASAEPGLGQEQQPVTRAGGSSASTGALVSAPDLWRIQGPVPELSSRTQEPSSSSRAPDRPDEGLGGSGHSHSAAEEATEAGITAPASAPGQQQQQRKEYRCQACGDGVLLMLTPMEILQHRRSHTSMANRPRA